MSSAIHFRKRTIFVLCLLLLVLTLALVYHGGLFDTPSGQRRILQAELQERINVLGKATLDHLSIFNKIPKRIVIFANDYSGYQYLEEILLTIPGTFIHKPLECVSGTDACDDRDWLIVSPEYRELLTNETLTSKIYPLLHCKSTSSRDMMGSSSIVSTDVPAFCDQNPFICSSEYFQRKLCEMSSMQVIVLKNFDFNMALSLKYLKHAHIVYMIRDPRAVATEQTELSKGTCPNFTHCFEVRDLCRSMESNEKSVTALVKSRHRNFKLLRFEELAFNLMQEMKLMFEGWGINFTTETYNVMSELKPKIDNTAFKWDKDRAFADISEIQEKCRNVLDFYAFKVIEDQKELDLQVRTVNDLKSRLETIKAE